MGARRKESFLVGVAKKIGAAAGKVAGIAHHSTQNEDQPQPKAKSKRKVRKKTSSARQKKVRKKIET